MRIHAVPARKEWLQTAAAELRCKGLVARENEREIMKNE
jgi:hypothetical protein